MIIRPKILSLSFVVILFSFFNITCKDSGMNLFDRSFSITTEDVSCTEVWLKIKIGPGNYDREVILKRDTVVLFRRTINELETTIIDTNLLPNHTYTYTAQLLNNSQVSNSTAQTMDTTSHNFTWQTFTLGDGTSSSVLHDVAIINDTCIWAVGEIYRNDTVFNAAKWNGQEWELKRIPFIGSCSAVDYPPLKAIWAFASTNILVTNGGSIVTYDGTNATMDCRMNSLLTGAINKIWATSSNDLYAVGGSGTIVHYNGNSWTKIESGTGLPIQDIWGAIDLHSGTQQILAIASNRYLDEGKRLFSISTTGVTALRDSGLSWSLNSIWFVPSRAYYVCGDGIYPSRSLNSVWQRDVSFPSIHKNRVRGTNINDVIVVGIYGLFSHFNGVVWQHFSGYVPNYENMSFESVDIKSNFVVAVGQLQSSQAVIVMGKRM